MLILNKQNNTWEDVGRRELAIGSIYKIGDEDEDFDEGVFMSFGHWMEPIPKQYKRSRMLIYHNSNEMSLPVYPSMTIGDAAITFMLLYQKGFYLFPHELLPCLDENGFNEKMAEVVNHYSNYKGKDSEFNRYAVMLLNLYSIVNGFGGKDRIIYEEDLDD